MWACVFSMCATVHELVHKNVVCLCYDYYYRVTLVLNLWILLKINFLKPMNIFYCDTLCMLPNGVKQSRVWLILHYDDYSIPLSVAKCNVLQSTKSISAKTMCQLSLWCEIIQNSFSVSFREIIVFVAIYKLKTQVLEQSSASHSKIFHAFSWVNWWLI